MYNRTTIFLQLQYAITESSKLKLEKLKKYLFSEIHKHFTVEF